MNWREIKNHYDYSVKELEKKTGVPRRTLEDWIAGRRTPPEYITRLLIEKLEGRLEGQKTIETRKTNNLEFLKKRSPLNKSKIEEILGEEYTIEDELLDIIFDIEMIENETNLEKIRKYLKKMKETLDKICN